MVSVSSISNNNNNNIRNQSFLCLFKQEIDKKFISMNKEKGGRKISLIRYNNQYYESTIGLSVSQEVRTFLHFSFESFIFSQIIGHVLGDGSLSMS